LQVVPKVGPSLFHAPLLLNDRLFDDARQHCEGHGDAMIVVAVDRCAVLERVVRLAKDDDAIVKLVRLDPEFGCSVSFCPVV
jgi:hypothetical protein